MSGTAIPFPGPRIPTSAQWGWDTSGRTPVVTSYPTANGPTKSGLTIADLNAFLQLPNIPLSDPAATQWIRWAEDDIETETNVRLCQTWIAAPPAKSSQATNLVNIGVKYNYQQLGVDYDFSEAGYDFFFDRAKEEGWLYQRLRWRPVKGVELCDPSGIIDPENFTGIKNIAMIYPLLNEFFRIPQLWTVEDQNRGLVRMVPAVNVSILPLVAMQLSFMGFASSVPSGLWYQYLAGLTAVDYEANWSFMRQLILARAGATALTLIQTGINMGVLETMTQVDGLALRMRYSERGPFYATIKNLQDMSAKLTTRAKMMGGGIALGIL
jgi:hypothetical protein